MKRVPLCLVLNSSLLSQAFQDLAFRVVSCLNACVILCSSMLIRVPYSWLYHYHDKSPSTAEPKENLPHVGLNSHLALTKTGWLEWFLIALELRLAHFPISYDFMFTLFT
jgi:hypothetical protein